MFNLRKIKRFTKVIVLFVVSSYRNKNSSDGSDIGKTKPSNVKGRWSVSWICPGSCTWKDLVGYTTGIPIPEMHDLATIIIYLQGYVLWLLSIHINGGWRERERQQIKISKMIYRSLAVIDLRSFIFFFGSLWERRNMSDLFLIFLRHLYKTVWECHDFFYRISFPSDRLIRLNSLIFY